MSRPLLVLIPGMMCDQRLFYYQQSALKQSAQIIVADITRHNTVQEIARDILNSIDQPIFSVAGLSMGAIIAMEMIHIAPERINRLGLFNTNHLADTDEKRELRTKQIDKINQGQLARVLTDEMKPNYLAPGNRNNNALLELVLKMGMELGDAVFIRQSHALANRPEYTQALKDYPGKTLVICGQYDGLCPVDLHHEMASLLTNYKLVEIKDCGHLSTLESHENVNQAMIEWLN